MAKRTTKRMFIMLIAVVLLIAVLAFGKYLQIKKLIASAPKPGAQTVTAMKAETLEWQPLFPAVGTLTPVRGVDVTSEIAGLVRTIEFKSGQNVKAGQVLAQLNADSDIALLNSLKAAAALSATTLARDRQQFDAQAIAQAQVDNDVADLKVKQANVAQQAALVAKKTIRAPFAGKLGITTINPGQYLNPGDKIVTLQTIDPIYIDFNLPQKLISELSVGQAVTLTSDAFPGESFPGKINAINPKVDAATRNVMVEATIANAKQQLLPGMFANVNVDAGGKKRYLTLPQTAITYNPYGSTVFVLKKRGEFEAAKRAEAAASGASAASGTAGATASAAAPAAAPPASGADGDQLVAQQVFVTTGPTRGDQVAVLSGVKEGDQVVTSGQLKLQNGTPVVVDNKVQPANDPRPTPQEK